MLEHPAADDEPFFPKDAVLKLNPQNWHGVLLPEVTIILELLHASWQLASHTLTDWFFGRVRQRPFCGHVVAATENLVRSARDGAAKKEDGLRRPKNGLWWTFEIGLDLDP